MANKFFRSIHSYVLLCVFAKAQFDFCTHFSHVENLMHWLDPKSRKVTAIMESKIIHFIFLMVKCTLHCLTLIFLNVIKRSTLQSESSRSIDVYSIERPPKNPSQINWHILVMMCNLFLIDNICIKLKIMIMICCVSWNRYIVLYPFSMLVCIYPQ